MTTERHFAPKRPYLTILLLQLALAIGLIGAGAYITISGRTELQPAFVAFIPFSIMLLVYLSLKMRWSTFFFDGLTRLSGRQWLDYTPLLAILVLVWVSAQGIGAAPLAQLGYLALYALLVGFVEETLYRGIILRLLLPKGRLLAILVSSGLFGVTHLLNAVGGQSLLDTLLQVVYAFLIGLVLALLVLKHRALPLAILFHAVHNFIQFAAKSSASGTTAYDVVIMLLLVAAAFYLSRPERTSVHRTAIAP
ncbi:CPBP family intramembrane metalloprotease [Paenibacillus sp. 598K]|uniref:CPBP family intramembrane glutamic endopeptidase n=1 Tax=Paenibacillus sp. 598K TaxID=1117987 RepID=UPI000FF9D4F0|nr:CPBP family intramembrane glutamic endopeptidase [Paenibacillus sp. 598K]GBF75633.1 CPBP family intramembrane metalloprotease [Paenibacillus sp. 598K]